VPVLRGPLPSRRVGVEIDRHRPEHRTDAAALPAVSRDGVQELVFPCLVIVDAVRSLRGGHRRRAGIVGHGAQLCYRPVKARDGPLIMLPYQRTDQANDGHSVGKEAGGVAALRRIGAVQLRAQARSVR